MGAAFNDVSNKNEACLGAKDHRQSLGGCSEAQDEQPSQTAPDVHELYSKLISAGLLKNKENISPWKSS